MGEFLFRHFSVKNEDSPMKVGTDGVLLGAIVRLGGTEHRILDVGTGTGVIALMLAQRILGIEGGGSDVMKTGYVSPSHGITASICGIEIDKAAAEEAAFNFTRSPWKRHMDIRQCSLEEFSDCAGEFDLIVSNPPYYDNSLQNPNPRRSEARHSVSLSYRELMEFASHHLSPDGKLAMILPSNLRKEMLGEAVSRGLFPARIVSISSTDKKAPSRIVVEISKSKIPEMNSETLTIQSDGRYSTEYLALMHDFYLFA